MTLGAEAKPLNIFRSFCKLLAAGMATAGQGSNVFFINYGQHDLKMAPGELFIPAGFYTWAEIRDELYGGGPGERPTSLTIHIYSYKSEDPFENTLKRRMADILGSLAVNRALIYNYGDTAQTQANPTATDYYFYPRPRDPMRGEGIPEEGIVEWIIPVDIYNWREDLYPFA